MRVIGIWAFKMLLRNQLKGLWTSGQMRAQGTAGRWVD